MTDRHADLDRLYSLLDQLERQCGRKRRLADCDGRMGWQERGVYFFFEAGEAREDGVTPRVVRVGTHALTSFSRTTLWRRLSQHKGQAGGSMPGGGNHRGSIFRLHIGTALLASDSWPQSVHSTWGRGSSAPLLTRQVEYPLERAVTAHIGAMPFLWLGVDNPSEPMNDRGVVEVGSIGLLSNLGRPSIDPPSLGWLGHRADRESIRESGLWNVNHVREHYHPDFLDRLQRYVEADGR